MNKPLAALCSLLAAVLLLTWAGSAVAAPATLKPKPLRCHVLLQGSGAEVCDKKPDPTRWKKGWWADPTSYRVIDANIYTEMDWEIPFDGYKSFGLHGFVSVNAKRGFEGTLKFPRRKPGVSTSVMTAGPVKGSAESEGAWTTEDGIFDCGVAPALGESYAPTSLTGIVAARPKSKEFSIQWAIYGAPVRCPTDGPVSNPTPPEIPSDAFTTRYPVAAFRKGEMFKLPVRGQWTHHDDAYGGELTIELGGSIVIRRVNNRIR